MIDPAEVARRMTTVSERARLSSEVASLREPAFRVISRMHDVPSHLQFNAMALALVATAEALGINPHDAVERAKRMMAPAEGPFTMHVQAIRDYARGELARA